MIIMSVDYGDVRTGIAVCDKKEMLASPCCVISERYEPKLIDKISELVPQIKPELIVVGLPRNMDGSYGERAKKCTGFADLLSEKLMIKTVLWDERLSTVSAYRALDEANYYGKKRGEVIDSVAATTILQDYLNFRKNNSANL